MLTAEELLRSASLQPEPEGHIVVGGNRFITIPSSLKRLGVQFDHNMETVTFDCPRYWDDRDMSKMAVYINYRLSNGYMDRYPADNVRVDGDIMHFDWTISKNVTQVAGAVAFLVCVMKTDAEGNEDRHWNSELCQDAYISPGMETEESPVDTNPDLITQLLLRMDSVEQINIQADEMQELYNATVEVANAAEEIKDQALDVSGQIRNSYANAIKQNASGEIIRVDDVSPIEHEVKCHVHGKNLFDISKIPTTNASTSMARVSEVGPDYIIVTTDAGYTGNGFCTVPVTLKDICPSLEVGKTYILSAETESNSSNIYFPGILKSWVFDTAMVVTEELLNSVLTFYGFSTLHNMGVGSCRISNIQIELGTVATDYASYIDPETVTVIRSGKNLFSYPFDGTVYDNGITFEDVGDGSIIVNGTNDGSSNSVFYITKDSYLTIPAGTYSCSPNVAGLVLMGVEKPGWYFTLASENKKSFTLSEPKTFRSIYVQIGKGNTTSFHNKKIRIMLEYGPILSEFESPASVTYTPSSDGACIVTSKSPTMTLFADTPGVVIEAEYNADTQTYLENCFRPTDEQVQIAVDAYLDENPVEPPVDVVYLTDRTTGAKYELYVNNGKLKMEVST